jgi:hypothetical protein
MVPSPDSSGNFYFFLLKKVKRIAEIASNKIIPYFADNKIESWHRIQKIYDYSGITLYEWPHSLAIWQGFTYLLIFIPLP